jgi:hypothetical protein
MRPFSDFSFKFEMCLANEVKLDTLKTQLHGQVRQPVFCLCHALNTCQQRIEIWFEKKVSMKWKSLHNGDKCVENLA